MKKRTTRTLVAALVIIVLMIIGYVLFALHPPALTEERFVFIEDDYPLTASARDAALRHIRETPPKTPFLFTDAIPYRLMHPTETRNYKVSVMIWKYSDSYGTEVMEFLGIGYPKRHVFLQQMEDGSWREVDMWKMLPVGAQRLVRGLTVERIRDQRERRRRGR